MIFPLIIIKKVDIILCVKRISYIGEKVFSISNVIF